jgi:hypothetical protein
MQTRLPSRRAGTPTSRPRQVRTTCRLSPHRASLAVSQPSTSRLLASRRCAKHPGSAFPALPNPAACQTRRHVWREKIRCHGRPASPSTCSLELLLLRREGSVLGEGVHHAPNLVPRHVPAHPTGTLRVLKVTHPTWFHGTSHGNCPPCVVASQSLHAWRSAPRLNACQALHAFGQFPCIGTQETTEGAEAAEASVRRSTH